jgi:hypothetical protein
VDRRRCVQASGLPCRRCDQAGGWPSLRPGGCQDTQGIRPRHPGSRRVNRSLTMLTINCPRPWSMRSCASVPRLPWRRTDSQGRMDQHSVDR